jgi:LPS-assembly protein
MNRVVGFLLVVLASVVLAPFASLAQPPVGVRVPTEGGEVSVVADRFEQIGPDNLLVATGNVEVTRGSARLLADRIEINRETGDATAVGRVIFYDGDDRLTGQRVDYNIKTGTGVVYQGEAHTAPYYRLMGERMERLGDSVYRVRRGVFTTCDDDPPTWSFRVGSVTADLESLVYGTNASFWVKSVPLIPFFPFFAAAIRRERQSGFLAPRVGNSSRKGYFAEIPFYWAISDSQDATLTFGAYSKRGFGGAAEYRYVISRDQRGTLGGLFVHEMFRGDETRGYGSAKHDWQITPSLSLRADLNAVSDDRVLREYESELQSRAAQRAESNLFATKSWTNWNLLGRVYWYQDLTTERPVELQRVPEITLQGVRQTLPGLPGFLYQVDSSFVNFEREVGSEGMRLDLHPLVSRPIPLAGYATLTPFVGGRITAYDTTVTGIHHPRGGGPAIEITNDDPRVRKLLEFGSDAESRLSRVYAVGGRAGLDRILHSIEPRVHFIRIIGHNFFGLPLWTDQIDRIPEANWFEYSVTNRIRGKTISPENTEATRLDLVRFVLGHAYDFENRRFGNLAADLLVQPSAILGLHADVSYNMEGEGLQTYTTDVSINVPRVKAVVGTRYSRQSATTIPYFVQVPGTFNNGEDLLDRPSINFLQGGLSVDVWRNLVFRMKTNWDLRSDTFVENRFGVDFKFDCWALGVEYVRRSSEVPGQSGEDELRFSIHLLGLGNVLTTRVGAGASDSGPRFK